MLCGCDLNPALNYIRGLLGRHNNRACCGRTSIESALRTFQHLNLRQVGILAVKCRRVGVKNAVNDKGKVGLSVTGTINTANTQRAIANFNGVYQSHTGRHGNKVLSSLHADIFNLALGKGRDCGRDILQGFRPRSGGNDYFFQFSVSAI